MKKLHPKPARTWGKILQEHLVRIEGSRVFSCKQAANSTITVWLTVKSKSCDDKKAVTIWPVPGTLRSSSWLPGYKFHRSFRQAKFG